MRETSKDFQLGRHQWVLPAVLLVLSIAVLTIGITADLQRAKHAIKLQTKFIAKACEENLDRDIQLISRLFRTTQEQLAFIRTWRQEDEKALAALLSGQQAASYVDALILVDENGMVRATNRGRLLVQDSLLKVDVSSEDYFRLLKDSTNQGLYIGLPTEVFKDQKLRVPIAQALHDRNGKLTGALIAVFDPKAFADFFSSLELGATASLAIMRDDGFLVMRQPQPADLVFATPLISSERIAEASGETEHFFEERSSADGELRIGFYRKMAGLPLVTFVSLSQGEVLENWRRDAVGMILIVFVLNLAVAGFSFFLTKSKFDRERDQAKMIEQQEMLSVMQNKVADKIGQAFFEGLTNCLTEQLGVRLAAIVRVVSGEHVQRKLLALSMTGRLNSDFPIEIFSLPLNRVVSSGQFFVGSRLADLFSGMQPENGEVFESFCGLPVHLANGTVAGVLFVADIDSIENQNFIQLVLSVFAPRVGAELERAMAEEARLATEEFRSMVSEQVHQAQRSEASAALTASFATELAANLERIYSLLNDEHPGGVASTSPLTMNQSSTSSKDDGRNMVELMKAVRQQRSLVERLSAVVSQHHPTEEPVMAVDLVNSALSLVRATVAQDISIQSEIEIDQSAHVFGEKATLKQLLFGMCLRCALESTESESEKSWMRITVKELSRDEIVELGFEPKKIVDRYVWFLLRGSLNSLKMIPDGEDLRGKGLDKDRELQMQMAQNVVDQHGGVFLRESRPDVGSFCQFVLPLQPRSAPGRGSKKTKKVSGKKILIVDDEQDLLTVLCDLLGHYGYITKGYTDSSEALKEFRQNPRAYDLVITDLTMPGLGGDDLAEHIMAQRTDLPILLCSGYNQKLSDDKAKQIGINKVIQKPFEFEDMVRTVNELLSRKS